MKYDVHISFDSRWNPLNYKFFKKAPASITFFEKEKKNMNKDSHYMKVIP